MSNTPRTDAAIYKEDTGHNGLVAVLAVEFGRQLERELNETKNQVRILDAAYQSESALTTRLEKHITDLEQRLTLIKSAAEASIDRAHTQGVMDSILRQEIARLKDEVAELSKDRKRLRWLLRNINRKGADDLACGIVTETDIDAAMEVKS